MEQILYNEQDELSDPNTAKEQSLAVKDVSFLGYNTTVGFNFIHYAGAADGYGAQTAARERITTTATTALASRLGWTAMRRMRSFRLRLPPVMVGHVLAHELTHYNHRDHLWSVLRGAALAVHWWNPLVWLAVGDQGQQGLAVGRALPAAKALQRTLVTGQLAVPAAAHHCQPYGRAEAKEADPLFQPPGLCWNDSMATVIEKLGITEEQILYNEGLAITRGTHNWGPTFRPRPHRTARSAPL